MAYCQVCWQVWPHAVFANHVCRGLGAACPTCGAFVTVGLPLCGAHTTAAWAVTVKPSKEQDGGLGLFATQQVNTKTFICPYFGPIERYPAPDTVDQDYELGIDTDNCYVDGYPEAGRGIGAMANTALRTARTGKRCCDPKRCNAAYVRKSGDITMPYWLQCTRPIAADQEILVDYGPKYVFQAP